jgi:hypothetical protein
VYPVTSCSATVHLYSQSPEGWHKVNRISLTARCSSKRWWVSLPEDNNTNKAQRRVGLCAVCDHMRRIESERGSIFYLCQRSADDPKFSKYPRLPVIQCPDTSDDLIPSNSGCKRELWQVGVTRGFCQQLPTPNSAPAAPSASSNEIK